VREGKLMKTLPTLVFAALLSNRGLLLHAESLCG